MHKKLLVSAAVVGSLFSFLLIASAVAAVSADYYPPEDWGDSGINWVTWPQDCSGDAVEFTFRVGNQEIGGDHELNHKVGNVDQEAGGQFAWGNGVDVDFTMTHDPATGDVTLSLAGGPSTTWHSGRPGEAVQNFFLLAKTGSSNPDYKSEVKNLSLNGQPIAVTLVSENKDKPSMRIYGEPFSDFVLQGTINFFWGSTPPNNGSQIEARISVTFAGDDIDGDGFGNVCDNCPAAVNPDLADTDSDNIGDVCDSCPSDPTNDLDSDGICGLFDNCPSVANVDQLDCNANGTGDACDAINPDAVELCDNADNNCNGSIDENLTQATSCGVGACAGNVGEETCTAGVWSGDTCDPLAGATAETCDNVDNNCDGTVDENLTQATACGVGECGSTGIETCTAGVWGGNTCVPGTPSDEICDNLDNNCDGTVDENLTQQTTCGVGACAGNVGEKTCTAGVWGNDTCDPLAGAVVETCNNLDDNCDGSIDENLTQATSCGVGACEGNIGEETCTAGVWGGDTCDPLAGATAETCNNVDDNCDGSVDENLIQEISCELPGACVNDTGVLSCIAGVWDNTCDSLPSATPEICDDIDNNCDGIVDEGVKSTFYQDSDGDTFGTPDTLVYECSLPPGFSLISGDCDDSVNTIYLGAPEICGDSIDQDCDGSDAQCLSFVLLEDDQGQQEFHDTIQFAYDQITPGNHEKIFTQAIDYPESLFLDHDVIVTMIGGHDELFSGPPTGWTTITSVGGSPAMTISNGTVTVANVILR